jgi:hypothetical protein
LQNGLTFNQGKSSFAARFRRRSSHGSFPLLVVGPEKVAELSAQLYRCQQAA